MFEILKKKALNQNVSQMTLKAPNVAENVGAGQFVILRVDETGERIPLTVFNHDKRAGTIDIIYQKVGATTIKLDQKSQGDFILNVAGPLGKKSKLKGYKKAIVVAGGVGCAIAYPLAKELKNQNCRCDIIAGFRNEKLIILENDMREVSGVLDIVTDDGSNGRKGFVTTILEEKLSVCSDYDLVIAVGPVPMMKAVCSITRTFGIKTIVSMTAIMIDGTGMCGGCRVKVDNKVKFACVDGPDFDGHLVDFDDAALRSRMFLNEEKLSREKYCNLFKGVSI